MQMMPLPNNLYIQQFKVMMMMMQESERDTHRAKKMNDPNDKISFFLFYLVSDVCVCDIFMFWFFFSRR